MNIFGILIILGILIIFVTDKINFSPTFVNIEIDDKYYNNYFPETANKKNYGDKTEYENLNNLTFPRTKPYKVFLYSNYNFIKTKSELSNNEIKTLLNILNDSSKYIWGELGTPEVHYYFKYFDKNENLIGVTKIDMEGMAYSKPYLTKMKWCGIKNINEINNLIKKIEK